MKKFLGSKLFILLVLLVLIVAFFAYKSEGLSLRLFNIRVILSQIVISALLVIGASYLMISGNLDLSSAATGTLCGMIMAAMLKGQMPWPFAVIIALLLGGMVGLINAILINELNFQGFIATMAVGLVAEGFTYVTNSLAIPIENETVVAIANGRFLDNTIPYSMFGVFIIFLIYGIILSRSKFGRQVYLVGGNRRAANLSGINPKKMSYKLFINNAMLSALAGCLFAAQMRSSSSTGISSNRMTGITAAMLGGISFGGGSGGMGGAFVGLLIINAFGNGLTIMKLSIYWTTFSSGALLVAALLLDYLLSRRNVTQGR